LLVDATWGGQYPTPRKNVPKMVCLGMRIT
jgi:hypothetical protein